MLMSCLSLALGKISSQTSTLAKYFLMIGTRDKRTCTNFGFKRKEIPSDGFFVHFFCLNLVSLLLAMVFHISFLVSWLSYWFLLKGLPFRKGVGLPLY